MEHNLQHNHNKLMFGKAWIAAYLVFFIAGIVMCCYGYAAVNSSVYISGEAVVKGTLKDFPITYMQEMTPAVCSRAKLGTEQQLLDIRDDHPYWVAKLADGNCWMVQNLAYVHKEGYLYGNTTDINPSTSPVRYDTEIINGEEVLAWWTYGTSLYLNGVELEQRTDMNNNLPISVYLGEYVIAEPSNNTACLGNSLQNCIDNGQVINVAGWSPTLAYDDYGVIYDTVKRTYDPHYLLGVYYTYEMAAGGTSKYVRGGTIDSSICPRGWRIPNGSDWYNLRDKVGAESHLIKSGEIRQNEVNNRLYGVNTQGDYWTDQRSSNNAWAWEYRIPGNYTVEMGRLAMRSVRCVAR